MNVQQNSVLLAVVNQLLNAFRKKSALRQRIEFSRGRRPWFLAKPGQEITEFLARLVRLEFGPVAVRD
jgi:hypothetical protein